MLNFYINAKWHLMLSFSIHKYDRDNIFKKGMLLGFSGVLFILFILGL